MPTLTLPDGSTRSFDDATTPGGVAADIGPGLAKAALGARVDGELVGLDHVIDRDATISLITGPRGKDPCSEDALWLIRHSAAHIMAEAVQRVFPEAQLVYGPPVDDGFYYDIAMPEGQTISSGDFERIEVEMDAIVKEDRPFSRCTMSAEEGMARLEGEGSKYKIDNARRALEAGADTLSWYATGNPGEHWDDLCRGPHVPSTGRVGGFKVMSVAASHWHGDADSDRLTRLYGTAFPDRKRLAAHLERLEEARKRDHRAIGRKLGLFRIDDMVGQGLVLWTPKGAIIRQELQDFISTELKRQNYEPVFTPHIGKLDLFRTSGHYPYYQDSQYPPVVDPEAMNRLVDEGCSCADLSNRLHEGEVEGYLLKPMNCPMHIRIFAGEPRSYRDLPVRLSEFGTVYRYEQSGELGGMLRVRGFTQDDAHLFCTESQLQDEIAGCLELVRIIFNTLGIESFDVRVGLRDPEATKYVGSPDLWDRAEEACRAAAETLGDAWHAEEGEAAFYGPKIDFIVQDAIGRSWQLGTVQVDYNLPERFDLSYIGPDNAPHRPVMIHRAPFGSMERFVGFLIEHFAGAFPAWLAPEQVRVLPVSEKSSAYAAEVHDALRAAGQRVTLDEGNERLQARIRTAAEEKIPYLLIVGPRDAEAGTVSVRARGIERDLGAVQLQAFVDAIATETRDRCEGVVQSLFADAGVA
ncbi:MAG: threonine--tRNA ligase [Phycisphaerales bacterium]|jgi:threonyl-tRNA synthetase|nr:threonine--tRNA ligase [Phycisphaerales bacterium]